MVTGPIAAHLGELARDRWRVLGAQRLPRIVPAAEELWPRGVTADLTNIDVAISRTMPASESGPGVRECEALFLDSIAQAERTIYIESQYFSSPALGHAIAQRLAEPRGPEVIVVAPKECHGWLERNTMGALRDGVFRDLIAADRHQRLRLVYPLASRAHDLPTFVHSKVMIVDDRLVRIGSANCSQRSLGMDTECDLAAEAGHRHARSGVLEIRNRLLGEHLGISARDVATELARTGSIAALIDARAGEPHTLAAIELPVESVALPEILKTAADPNEPVTLGPSIDQLVPAVRASDGHGPLRVWLLPAVVLVVAVLVAWTSSESVRRPELHVVQRWLLVPREFPVSWLVALGIFVLAGLALVPSGLLAIFAGLVLGATQGSFVGWMGSLATAAIGFGAGRTIGTAGLARWVSRTSYRSVRQVGARGLTGVIALRLAGVASGAAIALISGAGRVPFTTYLAGTAIAIGPTIAALAGLGALLRQTLLHPSLTNGLVTIAVAVVLLAMARGLRTLLLFRQFAPRLTGHRDRAEFG
jgi:uncharacterized membrane protein YdjX (TVP38/TMEM64 family)